MLAKIEKIFKLGEFAHIFFAPFPDCSTVKYTFHESGLKSFGRRLRVLRRERGLSQEEPAWKADSELNQISRMERGIVNAGLSQVFKIAEALEVHPRELFDFEFPVEELKFPDKKAARRVFVSDSRTARVQRHI